MAAALARVAIGGLFLARTTPLATFVFGAVGADAHPFSAGRPAPRRRWASACRRRVEDRLPDEDPGPRRVLARRPRALCGARRRGVGVPGALSGALRVHVDAVPAAAGDAAARARGRLDRSRAAPGAAAIAGFQPLDAVGLRGVGVSVGGFREAAPRLARRPHAGPVSRGKAAGGAVADWLLSTPGRRAIAGPAIAFGELALGPLLLYRRTRPAGLVLAAAFHLGIQWMGHPDVIGWTMLCLLLVFFDGRWLRRRQRTQTADSSGQMTSP